MKKLRDMANEQNLKPFQNGYDPRRDNSGRKAKIPELDELLADVLNEETEDGKSAAIEIIRTLVRSAKKGNVRAAEVLLNRAYGMPKNRVEVESKIRVVETEFDIYRLSSEEADQMLYLMEKATIGIGQKTF